MCGMASQVTTPLVSGSLGYHHESSCRYLQYTDTFIVKQKCCTFYRTHFVTSLLIRRHDKCATLGDVCAVE